MQEALCIPYTNVYFKKMSIDAPGLLRDLLPPQHLILCDYLATSRYIQLVQTQ